LLTVVEIIFSVHCLIDKYTLAASPKIADSMKQKIITNGINKGHIIYIYIMSFIEMRNV